MFEAVCPSIGFCGFLQVFFQRENDKRGANMSKDQEGQIIVIGAGTIGSHMADILQREALGVVLIDNKRASLDEVSERLDVQMLHGNGADPGVLDQANVSNAPLVLALTESCEINLLIGTIAKRLGARKVIARVRQSWCLDSSRINLRKSLQIDLLLNPEQLTAIEIIKFLDNPDALALMHYAHGKVQLRQFRLDEKSRFCGKELKNCDIPKEALVVVIARGDDVIIPHGDNVLEAGDRLTIIGGPDHLAEIQKQFHAPSPPPRNLVIAGGGNSGFFLAQALEHRNFQVKLVEPNVERCDVLSELLPRTTIINGNITRLGFLKEERVEKADVLIALTGDDEDNLMACLLAKELGVKQTVARINRPDYASVVQKMGIDMALSPRHVMANRVKKMIAGGKIQALSLMEQGKVEVVEIQAQADTAIVAKPLCELNIPKDVIISSIVTHGHAIVPRGDYQIKSHDRVIVTGLREAISEVEELFNKK